MSNKMGKRMYVPKNVVDELEQIKKKENLNKNVQAFNKILEHTRVGKEMEHMAGFWFGKKKVKN